MQEMTLRNIGMITALAVLCMTGSPAAAHVGVGVHFSHGFWHPLLGLDHVLAMVAVGFYATQLGDKNVWLVPAAFVTTMILGGIAGYLGVPLPQVEQAIGASVVAMGLAIAIGLKLPAAPAMAFAGLFAVFHGHAHGHEGASVGVPFLPFASGFVVATLMLHSAGIGIGLYHRQAGAQTALTVQRIIGVAGALAGVGLLSGVLTA
jgi:urease accessory protein